MYREVTMEEVKEVVLLWLARTGKKRIAAQLGLDVKTVRRYVRAALQGGIARWETDAAPLSEAVVAAILKESAPCRCASTARPGRRCEQHRAEIEQWLEQRRAADEMSAAA